MVLKKNKMDTSFINRNFRIKVSGMVGKKKVNTLVGVAGLMSVLNGNVARAEKYVNRACNTGADKCVCKIYGGARVTFYAK